MQQEQEAAQEKTDLDITKLGRMKWPTMSHKRPKS